MRRSVGQCCPRWGAATLAVRPCRRNAKKERQEDGTKLRGLSFRGSFVLDTSWGVQTPTGTAANPSQITTDGRRVTIKSRRVYTVRFHCTHPHPTSTQIPTQQTREKVLTFRLSMGVTGVPTGGASGSPASIRIKTALRALHDGRPPSFYAAGARVRCPWREPRHTGTTT